MAHKYRIEELDAQVEIKAAGFPITLKKSGERMGGPEYAPIFGNQTETTLYALDVSDDQKFRKDTAVARFEKIFMVSTDGITTENMPVLGDEISVSPTDDFPNLPTINLQITELRELSPAGQPIFYTFVLDGVSAEAIA